MELVSHRAGESGSASKMDHRAARYFSNIIPVRRRMVSARLWMERVVPSFDSGRRSGKPRHAAQSAKPLRGIFENGGDCLQLRATRRACESRAELAKLVACRARPEKNPRGGECSLKLSAAVPTGRPHEAGCKWRFASGSSRLKTIGRLQCRRIATCQFDGFR